MTLVGLSSIAPSSDDEDTGSGRLRVVRLRRPLYDRSNFLRRALWTFVTNTRLVATAWRELRRADEILFTGSPPFLIDWLVPLRPFFRGRLVYRLSDFHPEVLIAARGRASWPLLLLLAWTRRLRRRVDRVEVLGEDGRRRLAESGVEPARITIHAYGSPVEIAPGTPPLARPAEIAGRILLLYAGNFGVAHDAATFVAGYREHHRRGSGRVALWLAATGAKADEVEGVLRREGLPIARTPPVPLERLASLLVTPDAHLVTLADPFVGYVLPSKVFGCLESGRPLLFVGSAASDVDRLAREAELGERYLRVDPGDAAGVAAALERVADLAERATSALPPAG